MVYEYETTEEDISLAEENTRAQQISRLLEQDYRRYPHPILEEE